MAAANIIIDGAFFKWPDVPVSSGFSIQQDKKLITGTGTGLVSLADRCACVRSLLAHDSITKNYCTLIKVSGVTHNLDPLEMQSVANLLQLL